MNAPGGPDLEARLPQELEYEVRIAMAMTNTARELDRFQRTTLLRVARRRTFTAVAATVVVMAGAAGTVAVAHSADTSPVRPSVERPPLPQRTILGSVSGPVTRLPASVHVTTLDGPQNLGTFAFGDLWATTGTDGQRVRPNATLYRISADGRQVLSTAKYPTINLNQPDPVQVGDTIVVAHQPGGYTVFNPAGHEVGTLPSSSTLGAVAGDATGGWITTTPHEIARVGTGGQLTGQTLALPLQDISGIAVSSGELWVTDEATDRLVRVDPSTGKITGRTLLAFPPIQVQFLDNAVYVTTSNDYGLHRVDPATMTETAATVALSAVYASPALLRTTNGEVWTQALGGTISQLNPVTLRTERTIRLFSQLAGITNGAVIATNRTYVVDGEAHRLYSYPTR